jgi:hypothetical protein
MIVPFCADPPPHEATEGFCAEKEDTMLALARRRVLAERIAVEDTAAVAAYNARAAEALRLHTEFGALPYEGDIEHAPVVLLVANPTHDKTAVPLDHAFQHRGWPLAFLHPDAPVRLRAIWHARLASLIEAFGAQHVANSVAALPLTPWASASFDESLRLPSRNRMLDLAGASANRGALLIVTSCDEQWTESREVADLGCDRRYHARSWQATHVSLDNLGASSWHAACRRIEAHHWSRLAI